MKLHKTLAAAGLLWASAAAAEAQHWVEQNTWGFDNFHTSMLTWEQYRETFIGVPPENDPWSSVFDYLFYDLLYKDQLSKDGNCYGMVVLNLMFLEYGGMQGMCGPAPRYDESDVVDPSGALTRVINRVHGHQVNLPSLRHYLELIAKGKNRDGDYAYNRFEYYMAKEGPSVISITKSLTPNDGGHSMMAYAAEEVGGEKLIYVYDPSRPWYLNQSYYENDENVVRITAGGHWEFTKPSGTVWSGDPSSGGNILITPLSVTGKHSRLPSSLGLNALDIVNTIIISQGMGELAQVRDGRGRRLFRPGTAEVETDPDKGMLNLVPALLSDGEEGTSPAVYFLVGDPGTELEIEVESGPEGFEVQLLGGAGLTRVAGRGGRAGRESVGLRLGPGGDPALRLRNALGSTSMEVELVQGDEESRGLRELHISDLRLPMGATANLRSSRSTGALSVSSPRAAITYDLELRTATQSLELPDQRVEAGATRVAEPASWADLRAGAVELRTVDTADPAGRR